MNTRIKFGKKSFDIHCPVKLWDEEDGFNGYNTDPTTSYYVDRRTGKVKKKVIKGKRYSPRTFKKAEEEIKNFTVHYSVTYRADDTFRVLHNERKLSANFIIDDDANEEGFATIYQTLDIKDIGWSQGQCNATGSGVEVSWMPQRYSTPGLYSAPNREKYEVPEHESGIDEVHGVQVRIFKPTKAQENSLIQLIWGYCELTGIKPEFPKKDGKFIKTEIPAPEKYEGLLNHHNITRRKPDALGFDLERIEKEVKLRLELGY